MPKNPTVQLKQIVGWDIAYEAALRTVGKQPKKQYPGNKWRLRSLMAEHSQVKLVQYRISFLDLRQWVGVHLLRHPYVLPFIHSQRDDRREDIDKLVERVLSIIKDDIKSSSDFNKRDYLFQGETNDQDFYVNAQTFVNISRKRLCTCASKETRMAWQLVKDAIKDVDPVIYHCMRRQCVYRGFCPEMHPACRYADTEAFLQELKEYRSVCKSQEGK